MMYISKKRIAVIILCLLLVAASPYLYAEFQEFLEDSAEKKAYDAQKERFVEVCGLDREKPNKTELFIDVLDCLHQNSQHNINAEFYATFKQGRKAFLKKINDHAAQEPGAIKPAMACATRSKAIADILKYLGYEASETVVVKQEPNFPDHVVVDALDPVTKRMVMLDATYNVYVKDAKSGQILGTREIIASPLEDLLYCKPGGECAEQLITDFNKQSSDLLSPYYGLAVFHAYDERKRSLLYNPERFDLKTPQKVEEQKIYCEHRNFNCENGTQTTH